MILLASSKYVHVEGCPSNRGIWSVEWGVLVSGLSKVKLNECSFVPRALRIKGTGVAIVLCICAGPIALLVPEQLQRLDSVDCN